MSEDRLRDIEVQLLSHDKDIHSIANSVEKIAKSVELQTQLAAKRDIHEEQYKARLKEIDDKAIRAHKRIDEHDKVFKRVMWIVITPVMIALLGLVVHKTVVPNNLAASELKELTKAINSIKGN